jgi:hypothetical protein
MTVSCTCAPGAGPENVGSRLLSLLQSPPDQTLSAISGTAKKPQLPQALAGEAWSSRTERYGKSLSEMPICFRSSGLDRFTLQAFPVTFQCPSLIAQPEGWYSFAPNRADRRSEPFAFGPRAA